MTDFVHWLSTNQWVWLIGFFAGVLGTVSSIVFYYKSKRVKEPKYLIQSGSLIQDFSRVLNKLEICYAGRKISNLSSTTIVFWNDGREPITSADIASADPLLIDFVGEGLIMDCYLVASNNPANRVSVTLVNEKQALVKFEFLDFKQGAVVQVFHTGRGSDDLKLQGTVIGGGNFVLDKRYTSDDGTRVSILGKRFDFFSVFLSGLFLYNVGRTFPFGKHISSGEIIVTGIYGICLATLFYLVGSPVLPDLPRGLGKMDWRGWKGNGGKNR